MKKFFEFLEEVKYFIIDGKIVPVQKDEQGRFYIELPDETEEKIETSDEKPKKKGGKGE